MIYTQQALNVLIDPLCLFSSTKKKYKRVYLIFVPFLSIEVIRKCIIDVSFDGN